jgi:hypothetical protein
MLGGCGPSFLVGMVQLEQHCSPEHFHHASTIHQSISSEYGSPVTVVPPREHYFSGKHLHRAYTCSLVLFVHRRDHSFKAHSPTSHGKTIPSLLLLLVPTTSCFQSPLERFYFSISNTFSKDFIH